jgi:hypothetical protein
MAQRPATETSHPSAPILIVVVRSGGLAGIRQQWRVESGDDDGDDWTALVTACPWGSVGADRDSRDRFVWNIEARMPRATRAAKVPDALLVGPWRALVDRVQELGSRG